MQKSVQMNYNFDSSEDSLVCWIPILGLQAIVD